MDFTDMQNLSCITKRGLKVNAHDANDVQNDIICSFSTDFVYLLTHPPNPIAWISLCISNPEIRAGLLFA